MSKDTENTSDKGEEPVSCGSRPEEESETASQDSSVFFNAHGQDPTGLERILTQRFEPEDAMRITANSERFETARSSQDSSAHERSIIAKVFTNRSSGGIELPPDGGYGWVCCLCVTLIMFSSWGANSGFGVYLAYYLNNGVFEGASKYDYALIAGMTVAFGQGMAPVALVLARVMGFKGPMYIGIVLLFLGFLLASFATQLWQLYLTQGVMVGISTALLYAPATTVLPGWFLEKRSLALGLSLIGTGAGGVTYSVSVSKLIQDTGNQRWALRMMAIACTLTSIVATVLLRQRNPLKPCGYKSRAGIIKQFKLIFSLRVATLYSVDLVAIWFAFALFGYNLMIFTLSPYAVAKGLPAHQAAILTTCLNAAQSVGRPIMGYLGDRCGRVNTTVTLTAVLTVFMFAFWLNCQNFIQLLFFSICMGSCVGVANVMSTVLVADVVDPDDFMPAWSLVNSLGAPFLLVCEVIAQALTDHKNKSNPYLHTQIFAGLCFTCALILVLCLRELSVRRKLEKNVEEIKLEFHTHNSKDSHKDEFHRDEVQDKIAFQSALLGKNPKCFCRRMFHLTKV